MDTYSETAGAVAIQAPCGACKFLRKKCIPSCIFAPYFDSDQGVTRFAAVHKVFGTSNATKILLCTPANRRHCAAITLCYEAQARLSNPVYGCVSTILALKQQVQFISRLHKHMSEVVSLQAELAMVKTQIMNSRFAVENGVQTSQQQEEPNNVLSISNFSSNFNLIGETTYSDSHCFDPIAFTNHMFR